MYKLWIIAPEGPGTYKDRDDIQATFEHRLALDYRPAALEVVKAKGAPTVTNDAIRDALEAVQGYRGKRLVWVCGHAEKDWNHYYLRSESRDLRIRLQDIWESLEKGANEQAHPLIAILDICHATPLKLPVSANNLSIFSAVRHDQLATASEAEGGWFTQTVLSALTDGSLDRPERSVNWLKDYVEVESKKQGRGNESPHIYVGADVGTALLNVCVSEEGGQAQEQPMETSLCTPEALRSYREEMVEAWKSRFAKEGEGQTYESLFVPLDLVKPSDGKANKQPDEFESLRKLISAARSSAVLLVGEPGAGKTMLLRHLCADICAAEIGSTLRSEPVEEATISSVEGLIAYYIPLNTYPALPGHFGEPSEPMSFGSWVTAHFRAGAQLGELNSEVVGCEVWLLLDGLNEMPLDTRFDELRDFMNRLENGCRVVVSCRTQDVAGNLGDIDRAEVKPLDEAKVLAFLKNYLDEERGETAYRSLKSKKLLELYQNPFRLSLLVAELRDEGYIPENRAELFTNLLRCSLSRELNHRKSSTHVIPYLGEDCTQCVRTQRALPTPKSRLEGPFLSYMGRLAYAQQKAHPGRPVPLSYVQTLKDLEGMSDESEEWAKGFVRLAIRLGLLDKDSVKGLLNWPHQQLREYLAARHWVKTLDDEAFEQAEKPERVDDSWNPTLASLLEELKPGERLAERPSTGWEETALMAVALAGEDDTFLRRLLERDQVTAGRAVLSPGSIHSETIKNVVRQRLTQTLQDPKMELRTRVDAGEVLDDLQGLGYEAKVSKCGTHYLWPPTSTIPAGNYIIGSREDDPDAYKDEKPSHTFTLRQPLVVACHPVTNAEYALFMEAGGYDDERWWPEGVAWEWWKGGAKYRRTPLDNHPLQPVVSVSVFEAEAYLLWLSSVSSQSVRLLTEREWEACARGEEGRAWGVIDSCRPLWRLPWARRLLEPESLPRDAVNIDVLGLGRPHPVGALHTAKTPEGLYDLSGNIWEYTASEWTDNYREQMAPDPGLRVARGGSWSVSLRDARGACRLGAPLGRRGSGLGFRGCLAPSLKTPKT